MQHHCGPEGDHRCSGCPFCITGGSLFKGVPRARNMSPKKQHEVLRLAPLVAEAVRRYHTDHGTEPTLGSRSLEAWY